MKNVLMTGLAAGAAFGAFADFEIDLDLGEKPIRDARTSTCGPMVGYAGCLARENEAYWYGTNKVETARVFREAGAWFLRMWNSNDWFKDRQNWHDPNAKDPKELKAYKNFRPTHPELTFPFWKENGIKVLFTLEAWCDDQKLIVGYTCNYCKNCTAIRDKLYEVVGMRWRYWSDNVNIQDLQMTTSAGGTFGAGITSH